MAPTGSVLHLLVVLLPSPHIIRLVVSIHACILIGRQAGLDVCGDPFLSWVAVALDSRILCGGPSPGTRNRWTARTEETTRAIWTTRRHERRRGPGVRILL